MVRRGDAAARARLRRIQLPGPVPGLSREEHVREGIHPTYREVVFRDAASGATFKTRSTIDSSQTVEWEDGKTYPLVVVDISAASHPFWTGNQRVLDTAGRVERFRQRYGGRERPTSKQ